MNGTVSKQRESGAKLEIADMIATRIVSILKTDLGKADLSAIADINTKLQDVLSSTWRKSWKDGGTWKEHAWKNGAAARGELVSNPAEGLAKLEQAISKLGAEIRSR